jgi:hypothetical protein
VNITLKRAQSIPHSLELQRLLFAGYHRVFFCCRAAVHHTTDAPQRSRSGRRPCLRAHDLSHPTRQRAALAAIFGQVAKQQAKYNLNVVGHWVPNDDPAWKDRFVYLVVHPSRKAAEANWQALHSDLKILPYCKAADPLLPRVNGNYHADGVYASGPFLGNEIVNMRNWLV